MALPLLALGLAGIATGAGGAFLKGRASEMKKEGLEDVADTPPLDIDSITGQSLATQLKYLPEGSELSKRIGKANQENLMAMEEMGLSGIGKARETALGSLMSSGIFGDSSAKLKEWQRIASGMQLGRMGGGAGSSFSKINSLRYGYNENIEGITKGVGILGSLINSMRLAGNSPGVQLFLAPSVSETINQRSQERQQRMNLRAQASQIGGQTEAWGNYLSPLGGLMTGAAMGGGTGMIGGGLVGGMSSAPTTTWGVNSGTYGAAQGMLGITR